MNHLSHTKEEFINLLTEYDEMHVEDMEDIIGGKLSFQTISSLDEVDNNPNYMIVHLIDGFYFVPFFFEGESHINVISNNIREVDSSDLHLLAQYFDFTSSLLHNLNQVLVSFQN